MIINLKLANILLMASHVRNFCALSDFDYLRLIMIKHSQSNKRPNSGKLKGYTEKNSQYSSRKSAALSRFLAGRLSGPSKPMHYVGDF